jgi:hypothetical protein
MRNYFILFGQITQDATISLRSVTCGTNTSFAQRSNLITTLPLQALHDLPSKIIYMVNVFQMDSTTIPILYSLHTHPRHINE